MQRPHSHRALWLAMTLVVVVTFAARARYFGNPIIDADEGFYLMTGARLFQGALPYVDIWDRKPLGLFLLYGGMSRLGGDGVLAYQLVAASFVAATAVFIALMARRIASPSAAIVAALAYAPLLGLSGGQGGQTPVFYNLPVAVAAWLILGRVAPLPDRAAPRLSLRWLGTITMLLIGLALQIKPTAIFEGMFFGLVLIWLSWRAGPRLGRITIDAMLWVAAALAPTVLAYVAYIALGHGAEFAYANFGSIFGRASLPTAKLVHNVGHILGRTAPILPILILAEWLLRRRMDWRTTVEGIRAHHFLAAWLLVGLAGFAVFGSYFNHYVLPLLPPILVVSAPALGLRDRRIGIGLSALLLLSLAIWYPLNAAKNDRKKGNADYGYAMADRIRPLLRGGCLYVFYNEPIYYHLTNSCLLTRWPFPYHFSLTREAEALGVDPAAELRKVLARKPMVVLTQFSDDPEVARPIEAILRAELAKNYRLVYAHTFGNKHPDTDQLYARIAGR